MRQGHHAPNRFMNRRLEALEALQLLLHTTLHYPKPAHPKPRTLPLARHLQRPLDFAGNGVMKPLLAHLSLILVVSSGNAKWGAHAPCGCSLENLRLRGGRKPGLGTGPIDMNDEGMQAAARKLKKLSDAEKVRETELRNFFGTDDEEQARKREEEKDKPTEYQRAVQQRLEITLDPPLPLSHGR